MVEVDGPSSPGATLLATIMMVIFVIYVTKPEARELIKAIAVGLLITLAPFYGVAWVVVSAMGDSPFRGGVAAVLGIGASILVWRFLYKNFKD